MCHPQYSTHQSNSNSCFLLLSLLLIVFLGPLARRIEFFKPKFTYENRLSNTSQGFIRSDPSKHLEHLWKWRNTMFTFSLEPSQLESSRTFQRVSKRSKHFKMFLGV